ncbi:MAG: PQQ-dependent sugar dehydrogenase, partial [Anaerolineae bacterium]|nr:PQQ-dependent sugar dehydrogenase [Anaerolineae bacterium]
MPSPHSIFHSRSPLVMFTLASLIFFACRIPSLGQEPPLDSGSNQVDLPPASPLPAETTALNSTPATTPGHTTTSTPTHLPPPTIPDPAGYRWDTIADGFERPLDLTHAGDDSGRLFLVEQGGLIHILQDGQVLPTPFLDIRGRVRSVAYEQGLLGLAFHPLYADNGYFYVNYTDLQGDTVIARYNVSADLSIADPDSEIILLQVEQPYENHNGGGLAFGPDGYLYIGLGDGGSGGDPLGNGQALDTLLGKLLRIDVDRGS